MNKMRFTWIAVSMFALTGMSHAQTAATPAAPSPAYSTADSLIGDLLDNPATRAIVEKYLPEVVHSDQIDMARGMTLVAIQAYAADSVTDEALKKIDEELAKLPKPTT